MTQISSSSDTTQMNVDSNITSGKSITEQKRDQTLIVEQLSKFEIIFFPFFYLVLCVQASRVPLWFYFSINK